jgi:flagellar hook-length control protein FliK
VATEREQSHSRDSDATYFAPADLALAWLASSDVTPRSPKTSGEADRVRGSSDLPSSKTGTPAARATDSQDSRALVLTDQAAPRAESDEQVARGQLRDGTAPGTSPDVTESGTDASGRSLATSDEHRRDGSLPHYVTSTPARDGEDVSDLSAVSRTRPAPSPAKTDATTSAISLPSESAADLATRRWAPHLTGDGAEPRAGGSTGSDPSRDRELPAIPESDRESQARTISPAATAPPAMPPPVPQSRPGEMAARPDGSAEATEPGQGASDAFVTANSDLTAAVTKAQRDADGSYRVTAFLNPPSLGRVDATIKVNGDSVEVAITPHTPEGHEALSGHLDELQRELASEHGEVHLSLTDSGGHARHGGDPRHELPATHPSDEDDAPVDVNAPSADSSLHIIL